MLYTRRNRPATITDAPEHRAIPLDRIEVRDSDDDENVLRLSGYASTFESYEMYGGPAQGGWIEQISRGAFDKTLREKPDLHLLINHAGMPLARTKSGTLKLSVDDTGLRVDAELDRRDPEVQALEVKMRRGDMDEMSFAFRVKAQEWEATADHPDDDMALRTITEVSLHKGDVSVVNFGANPTTSASVRSVEEALKVIAEADHSELVEARCADDVLRQAQEKLGSVKALNAPGPMVNIEIRSDHDVRAWLDAEEQFLTDAWLAAERDFVQSWLDTEDEFVALSAWLAAEKEFRGKGMSLRLARALSEDA